LKLRFYVVVYAFLTRRKNRFTY